MTFFFFASYTRSKLVRHIRRVMVLYHLIVMSTLWVHFVAKLFGKMLYKKLKNFSSFVIITRLGEREKETCIDTFSLLITDSRKQFCIFFFQFIIGTNKNFTF